MHRARRVFRVRSSIWRRLKQFEASVKKNAATERRGYSANYGMMRSASVSV
jgi:hypothetical protein